MCPEGATELCQIHYQPTNHRSFSRISRPFLLVLLGRAFWHRQNRGLWATFGHTARWLFQGRTPAPKPRAPLGYVETLALQPGDWVEVKCAGEIGQTLDSHGTTRGLKFLPDMLPLCGRRFRVHKRLETLFMEESRQIRKIKNTVLLEGVYCNGAGYGCDRSCFYYWREAWLNRVAPPVTAQSSPPAPELKL